MTKRELFVGRLPSGIEASALRDMFEKFGSLSRCDLKSSSGGTYGFISYDDPKHAEEALKDLHNKDVQGSKINVEWAKSRERGRGERRRYSPRYSPYSSKRRYSRSPSPYVNLNLMLTFIVVDVGTIEIVPLDVMIDVIVLHVVVMTEEIIEIVEMTVIATIVVLVALDRVLQ
jgi:RNA recognition motif-containing protein